MNIIESLDLAIEVSESGRPGAAVKILQSLTAALKDGRDLRGDFFQSGDKETIIRAAQDMAFSEESKRKAINNILKEDDLQDVPSGDVA